MVDQEVTGGRNINRGMIVRGPWKIKVITKGQSSKLKIVWEPNSPTAFCETEEVLEGKLMKGRFPSCFYFFHLYLSFSFSFFFFFSFYYYYFELLTVNSCISMYYGACLSAEWSQLWWRCFAFLICYFLQKPLT